VLKLSATGSVNELVSGVTFSPAYVFGQTYDGTQKEQFITSDNYLSGMAGTASANTNFHQTNAAWNNTTTVDLRADCTSDGSYTYGGFFATNTTGLGRNKPAGGNTNPFTGDLALLEIYDRKLNSTEIGQMEGYITAKYGVLGSCVAPATNVPNCAPFIICPGH